MNLHVFNDVHGFFLNLTVKRFTENDAMQNNFFINLNNKSIYKNEKVKYLKKNTLSFKQVIKSLPIIQSVTFYPFDFTAAAFLNQLQKMQPSIKVNWVFWGYEFYHRPDNEKQMFDEFSSAYYKKQFSFFKNSKQSLFNIIKSILLVPVFDKQFLADGYAKINRFYSFLPQDFKNGFQNNNNACEYYPISFLSIEEITEKIVWGNITNEVMVGHAASPSLNHAEILDMLHAISFSGKLFLPLEYGEEEYRKEIKNKANDLFNSNVVFLENRLTMPEYYQRLSVVGFAIFNFRWQEALGNILFLVWNGTKIFLKQDSSVYKQFISWRLIVFSIEQQLNKESITQLLTVDERQNNKRIIEELFSEQKVKNYWNALIEK